MLQTVNTVALATAAELVVGAEATARIQALYVIIDNAMFNAYQLGKTEAEEGVEAKISEAFDNGFDFGEAYGEAYGEAMSAADDSEYDEGYLAGVADARARPDVADAVVEHIIQKQDKNAINGEFDIDFVRDSGDEA